MNHVFSCFGRINITVCPLQLMSAFIHGFDFSLISDSCTDKVLKELIMLKSLSISANDYAVKSNNKMC